MKLITLSIDQLVNGKTYHVYDPNLHTYFPAKWDKESRYFDTELDKVSLIFQSMVQSHYSPNNRELMMDADKYKKAAPMYIVKGDKE